MNNISTDELFEKLPSFIIHDGNIYNFKLIKGHNGIIIEYKMDNWSKGHFLGNTYRRAKTLREVIIKTLNWLTEFKYI